MRRPVETRSDVWAVGALGAAGVALVTVFVMLLAGTRGDVDGDDGTPNDTEGLTGIDFSDAPPADPAIDVERLVADAASTMGGVSSVEFEVTREGAPVYIDEFESIRIDSLLGQFVVPGRAQATIDVTVDDNLRTRIGAVALADEVWISNPITGRFETLPDGYDIDPSRLFNPNDGWRPLIENLADVELVGIDERDGERYHLRGVAAAANVENITAGLIAEQSVPVDLWLVPGDAYLTDAEFTTTVGDDSTDWTLQLSRYDAPFDIEPPDDVVSQDVAE